MYGYIDYSDGSLEDRLDNVNKGVESGFFEEYFDNAYNYCPTKEQPLAEGDGVCMCLEYMADYILNCDEEVARKKREKEYIYFSSRSHLNRKLNKELTFGSLLSESKEFNDVIINNIAKDEVGRIALPKEVDIEESDFDDPGLRKCLEPYQDMIDSIDVKIKSGGGNRKKLSFVKYDIKQDMITIKKCYHGLETYKHDNINMCCGFSKSYDLTDRDVVYGFTNKQGVFTHGLLFYEKPDGLDVNNPFSVALHDLNDFLEESPEITKRDRRMIYMLRQGLTRQVIATVLRIDESQISKDLDRIVNTITEGCQYGK